VAGLLALGFLAIASANAWWAILRAPDLLERTDNARRSIADRYVPRGSLLDRNNQPIHVNEGQSGTYRRVYLSPDLAPVTGYTHPTYGQAGLEAALDDYLRGLKGNPSSLIWWDHLLYGTPPPGLDVRLSLSLALQTKADQLLGGHTGAIVLMNAQTGEILAMASHPTYDPNKLSEEGGALAQNKAAPLINRAAQGFYPLGGSMLPLLRAKFGERQPSDQETRLFYAELGFFEPPAFNLPVAFEEKNVPLKSVRISPLHAALAASALSAEGVIPPPRIAIAVNTPEQGWVILSAAGTPKNILQKEETAQAALSFTSPGKPYWSHISQSSLKDGIVTWLLAGTLPDWKGAPLALAVTLEENNAFLAAYIGETLLNAAINQ
jgi:cell division protein FtsI/penicillin-binding protein 2